MKAYVIRETNTGKLVEAHDEISLEWAISKVETHNKLCPSAKWELREEDV